MTLKLWTASAHPSSERCAWQHCLFRFGFVSLALVPCLFWFDHCLSPRAPTIGSGGCYHLGLIGKIPNDKYDVKGKKRDTGPCFFWVLDFHLPRQGVTPGVTHTGWHPALLRHWPHLISRVIGIAGLTALFTASLENLIRTRIKRKDDATHLLFLFGTFDSLTLVWLLSLTGLP